MRSHIKTLILFTMLLCSVLSMTPKRNMNVEDDSGTEEAKIIACFKRCFGEYQSCVKHGDSNMIQSLCKERKIRCLLYCSLLQLFH